MINERTRVIAIALEDLCGRSAQTFQRGSPGPPIAAAAALALPAVLAPRGSVGTADARGGAPPRAESIADRHAALHAEWPL